MTGHWPGVLFQKRGDNYCSDMLGISITSLCQQACQTCIPSPTQVGKTDKRERQDKKKKMLYLPALPASFACCQALLEKKILVMLFYKFS